jgi:hypothetical protein
VFEVGGTSVLVCQLPRYDSTTLPLPVGPEQVVTHIELDDQGIPRQYTETAAWIARPVGEGNNDD